MSKENEKLSHLGLQVKVSKYGSPRIAQLLQNTVFGTEGKLRYRQPEISERIRNQSNIQFIEVLKGNRVLGTVGMAKREVLHGEERMPTLYVRYLSVAQPFKKRDRAAGKTKKIPTKKNGILRDLVNLEIINHFELPFIEKQQHGVFYAYVESANANSRDLCMSMGFESARKMETLIYSRFNPIQKKSIQNIAENEQDFVRSELQEFYKDYSFYFEDRLFTSGFYLVKKEKGEIIGGIRVHPVHWQLVEYPGFEGWLMRDFLPYLPLTNRLFQPGIFKFLAFDYVWHKENQEHLVTQLMSHCCSLFGINAGMIWGDMHSDLIKNLKSGNELGFIHSVVGSVYADLMIRPIKSKSEQDEEIESKDLKGPDLEFPLTNDDHENPNEEQESTEKATEKEEVENSQNSGSDENTDSEVERSEETDEFKQLNRGLTKPVFVSALDMT